MRVAALQMTSRDDPTANRATAARLVEHAASRGADLVVLPEMFNNLGSGRMLRAGAEPLEGPTASFASQAAAAAGVWLLAGSFIEAAADGNRYNTSLLVSPTGEVVQSYRKIHLFDVTVPGAEFHESDVISPGTRTAVADLEGFGRLGFSICYDLRFPELYRRLALDGAQIVVVPAAFTARTGPPHWEVLLRARAIENQVFVVAAGQTGASDDKLAWHGHSMVVDPWGTVVAQAGDGEHVVLADIDLDELRQVRAVLPSLANRQPSTYGRLDGEGDPTSTG
jgi:predicted amidohydrolase